MLKKRILSVVMALALVATGILGASGSILAADNERAPSIYDAESIQALYEDVMESADPAEAFLQLSQDAQKAVKDAYEEKFLETISNIRVERKTVVVEMKGTRASGEENIVDSYTGYNGSTPAYYFEHSITWTWTDGYVTDIDVDISGEGYTTGVLRWEYVNDPERSYYTEDWSDEDIFVTVDSQGFFDVFLGGWCINSFYEYLDSTVYGDGTYSL